MGISPPSYQLRLDLDLPESGPEQAGLNAQEIRVRAEAARRALEGGELWPISEEGTTQAPAWFEEYLRLRNGGWPWRVAVYVAWLAMPRAQRWPKTQDELAQRVLGLTSDRQFSVWRAKNPAIDAMVQDIRFGMIYDALGDVFAANIEVAARPDYKSKGDRELLYKLAGILSDKIDAVVSPGGVPDLSKLSFEEKLRLAGLDNPEALAKLKRRLAMSDDEDLDDGDENSDAD